MSLHMPMENVDSYYNPPKEWSYESIVSRYLNFNNTAHGDSSISFEGVEKYPELIRIKKTLHMISDELKSKDPAAIDISVSFVASPVYFHYSGYIRATMARRLKHCSLNIQQKRTLINGIERLIENRQTSHEFKEIKALYMKVKMTFNKALLSESLAALALRKARR